MVICLERGADLHAVQLMPLPLTVSCFSKIQIGFTFLVPAHLGSPGKRAVKCVCVYVCGLRLFTDRVINVWNSLPQDTVDFAASLFSFKRTRKLVDFTVFGDQ